MIGCFENLHKYTVEFTGRYFFFQKNTLSFVTDMFQNISIRIYDRFESPYDLELLLIFITRKTKFGVKYQNQRTLKYEI